MINEAKEARAKALGLANALRVRAGVISQDDYNELRRQVKAAEAHAGKLEADVRKQLNSRKGKEY